MKTSEDHYYSVFFSSVDVANLKLNQNFKLTTLKKKIQFLTFCIIQVHVVQVAIIVIVIVILMMMMTTLTMAMTIIDYYYYYYLLLPQQR